MMKCVIRKCGGQVKLIDTHYTQYNIVHRKYECVDCFTTFKTSEKVVFNSIPKYVREKFINEGERL